MYRGTLPEQATRFVLDKRHGFDAGRVVPVSGNTWRMLHDSRLRPHFDFIGSFERHYGRFTAEGPAMPFDTAARHRHRTTWRRRQCRRRSRDPRQRGAQILLLIGPPVGSARLTRSRDEDEETLLLLLVLALVAGFFASGLHRQLDLDTLKAGMAGSLPGARPRRSWSPPSISPPTWR